MSFEATLASIDAEIDALRERRREVEAEKQAGCEHNWEPDILHYGGLYCTRCMASDLSNACSRIDWPVGPEWPFECPPREFCWTHKRPAVECVR